MAETQTDSGDLLKEFRIYSLLSMKAGEQIFLPK